MRATQVFQLLASAAALVSVNSSALMAAESASEDEPERGVGLERAEIEVRLIYVDRTEAEKWQHLSGQSLAEAIFALPETRRREDSRTISVWPGEITKAGFGMALEPSLTDQAKPRPAWADNLAVGLAFGAEETWTDAIGMAIRCTCYGAASADAWWEHTEFLTSFVIDVEIAVGGSIALGKGVPAAAGKELMFPVVQVTKIEEPTEEAPKKPLRHRPIWSAVSEFGILRYEAQDLSIDEEYIYVVGLGRMIDPALKTDDLNYGDKVWTLEKRRKSDGAIDATFGRNGFVFTNPAKGPSEWRRVAVDDAFVYVAAGLSIDTPEDFCRIEKRDKATGKLVAEFGRDGAVTSPETDQGEEWTRHVRDLIVFGDHLYLLCIERTWTTSWSVRVEKRDKRTGALVPEFADRGILRSPRPVYAWDMDISGDALYLIGKNPFRSANRKSTRTGGFDWHIEKRSTLSGALDEQFGTGGVLRHNPSPASAQPTSVAADADHVFIAGYDTLGEGARWRIERRSGRTGALEQAFGEAGLVSVDTGPWYDACERVLVDEDHLYLTGSYRVRGSGLPDWRVEKRKKVNGALVTGFGAEGQVFCDHRAWRPGGIIDFAMDQEFLYLLREDSGIRHSDWRVEKRSKVTGGMAK